MTKSLSPLLCVAVIAIGTHVTGAQQVFRSTTTMVEVDVTVLDGKRPVTGLEPSMFEVRDKGLVQSVVSARFGTDPIDVTVLLDVSGSLDFKDVEARGSLTEAAERITKGMTTEDTWRVTRFGEGGRSLDGPEVIRQTVLFDAILASVIAPLPQQRRRLVVVLTDGLDVASTTPHEVRAEVLRRTEAVVLVVAVARDRPQLRYGSWGEVDWFLKFAWAMTDVAKLTGGRFLNVRPDQDYVDDVLADIAAFRSRYTLAYAPTDASVGWHDIEVRMVKGRYRLQHKPGYWRPSD